MTNAENCAFIIKNDAIEDGIDSQIIEFIDSEPNVEVISSQKVFLTPNELLEIYKHELDEDPSERREILIAMGAIAMNGINLAVGVRVYGVNDLEGAFQKLNQLKGPTNSQGDKTTVRGRFPFSTPSDFDSKSFWFRAPFFVRNRIHVPSTVEALQSLESILACKGITRAILYGESLE